MAYPATKYSQVDVSGTTLVATDDHSARHNAIGAEIVAIETTLGTNSGTAILKNFTDGKFAARTVGETFGTNTWIGGTVGTATIGTCTITGGTIASLFVGTAGTAMIGTSTIQGGTANRINMKGYISPAVATTLTVDASGTLDLALANEFRVAFGTANGTLVTANATDGQKFLVSLTQDAVGTRLITWFSTIRWPAATTPTLTATASKRDTFGFIVTGANTYDGFIVGTAL